MTIKFMNNARVDRMLYVLDHFENNYYFTRKDVVKDFMDGTQQILFDHNEPVAVFTLERIINRLHFKRFSILDRNYGREYFKTALKLCIDENLPIVITVLPTNAKVIAILKELGMKKVDGRVKSQDGLHYYDLYETTNFDQEAY